MSAESTLILAGLLVALTPFLGLPSVWYGYIFSVLGLIVLGIGLLLRTRRMANTQHLTDSSSQGVVHTHNEESPHEPSPMA